MNNSQPARRGRPPIQDGQDVVGSQQVSVWVTRRPCFATTKKLTRALSLQKKKLGMRLAQRSYRARKQEAQESQRIRAEAFSRALDNALATFSTLHRRILDTSQARNLPDVLFHLNDAVGQMTAIASSTNKVLPLMHAPDDLVTSFRQETPGVLAPHQSATVDSGTMTISLRTTASKQIPVPARLFQACFERVVSILSNSTIDGSHLSALTLPLQLLGVELLMVNSLRGLSLFPASVGDFKYPLHSAPRLPNMYRVVEGETKAVFRMPAPSLQRIVRGKTRTILDTNLAHLQGEWLEAMDLEEYLEERGIYMYNTVTSDTATTGDTMNQPSVPGSEQSISMEQSAPVSSSAGFPGHEPADYLVFGLAGPRQWLRSASSQIHSSAIPGDLQSDFSQQTTQGTEKASRVTVDLDKLVHMLAENATCLGPAPGIRKADVDASIRGSITLS
ncbi:hypothetical protein FOIG_05274 [Fusarium odoratissimum NRRL 54006]|uniref:BZIP domain-containing protein n=2 Tax=Fusarium oxysporum species complex TaxID=171631 RepID=X0JQL3_FUSO5|nr:uncharacterized protein FOIG_05274 [Fusarium odoratissimum NRRL 54006]EXM03564.1 hypothetical protein FOIG_05274 [Fusarium odoratissimum NRRL 54006]TXC10500.1 hypothetical protein FocTR4_00005930 [Fusarium oxysporum f. sp. cubense]